MGIGMYRSWEDEHSGRGVGIDETEIVANGQRYPRNLLSRIRASINQ